MNARDASGRRMERSSRPAPTPAAPNDAAPPRTSGNDPTGTPPREEKCLCARSNGFHRERVHLNLLEHRRQTVGARLREVLTQANLVNKVGFRRENLIGRVPAEYTEHDRDEPFDDRRIAIRSIDDFSVFEAGQQPHLRLTALHLELVV